MGRTFINADLSQAELRVMALLSNDEWMIAALQEDQDDFFDTHLMPAAYPAYPESYWEIVGVKSDGKGLTRYQQDDYVQHKEDRTKVKAVQYGLAFGRQAPAIARSLGMSVREAEAIITNYLHTAYNFAQWREDIMEAAVNPAKRDILINPFGRTFQSEVITTKNRANIQREALSFLPQSTSSDICLATAVRINEPLKRRGYRIFNIVHDAIMIEGEESGADEIGKYVAAELRKTGLMVMGDRVPFLSDYSVGKSWGDLD